MLHIVLGTHGIIDINHEIDGCYVYASIHFIMKLSFCSIQTPKMLH